MYCSTNVKETSKLLLLNGWYICLFPHGWILANVKILSVDESMPAAAGCRIDEGNPQKVCFIIRVKASNLSWRLDVYGWPPRGQLGACAAAHFRYQIHPPGQIALIEDRLGTCRRVKKVKSKKDQVDQSL